LYRSIQVLNGRFNEVYSPLMLTICPFVLLVIEIICGVATIKVFWYVPIVVFCFFPVLKFGIAMVLIAIMQMAGEVNKSCCNLGQMWNTKLESKNTISTLRSAFGRSCQPAVAKLGAFTSIDIRSVPFYVNFVIMQTISALVLMEFD